jgi:hypothetical protein
MTLLVTLITALMSLFGGDVSIADKVDTGNDLRRRENQQAFHEEDMFSAAQMGHCPHG